MDSNYKKIFSGNTTAAQLIIDQLKSVDINPIVKDESESGRLAGFASAMKGNVDVYVHLDEMDRAEKVLDS